jgi:peptidoglycan hydrolase CwlO-like protein
MSVSKSDPVPVQSSDGDISAILSGGQQYIDLVQKRSAEIEELNAKLAEFKLKGSAKALVESLKEKEAILNKQHDEVVGLVQQARQTLLDAESEKAIILKEAGEVKAEAAADRAAAAKELQAAVAERAAMVSDREAAGNAIGRANDLVSRLMNSREMVVDFTRKLEAVLR